MIYFSHTNFKLMFQQNLLLQNYNLKCYLAEILGAIYSPKHTFFQRSVILQDKTVARMSLDTPCTPPSALIHCSFVDLKGMKINLIFLLWTPSFWDPERLVGESPGNVVSKQKWKSKVSGSIFVRYVNTRCIEFSSCFDSLLNTLSTFPAW